MSLPRTSSISSSEISRRLRPWNITLPATERPGRESSRMMLSAVIDLPQPDSPTTPRVSRSCSEKLTPSTAFTVPSLVKKCVRSPSTESSAPLPSAMPSALQRPRVEGVAERVADVVEGEHGHQDQQPRPERVEEPDGAAVELLVALVEQRPPGGGGLTDADTEERQRRLQEDGGADGERGGD